MRHQKSGRHLNRTSAHRKAMLSNMSTSLIEHETIKTTVVKAKELRRFVEPLITLSKTDTVANRRRAFAKLRSKSAVGKLFSDLGPRYQAREGGYTRILKAGFRRGDSAMVAYMQLVDQPERLVEQQPEPLLADEDSQASATESEVIVEAEEVVEEQTQEQQQLESSDDSSQTDEAVETDDANETSDEIESAVDESDTPSDTQDTNESTSAEDKPRS